MEAEGTLMPSTDNESTNESFAHRQPSISDFSDDTTSPSSKPCFDCSICLDFAADPVVTLCGHLYCWPCIYKWIQIGTSQHDCPVCKSPLSPNSLVPLYGRGATSKNATANKKCVEIPDRPAFLRNVTPTPNRSTRQEYHHPSQWGGLGVLNQTVGGVFGGLVVAILPLVSRSGGGNGGGGGEMNFMRVNQVTMVGSSERERRVEDSLHQIWMFFFSCVVLWWLFF